MKPATHPRRHLVLAAIGALALFAVAAMSPEGPKRTEPVPPTILPLSFGSSMPIPVQSPGVVWNGNTYHLVKLRSIRFDLDAADRLKAEVQAEVTTFDNVDYDISAAVFDERGQMLGTARTQCKVERIWLGRVGYTTQSLSLDFGVSLDYTRAAACLVSISSRKVLTPADWQR